MLIENFRLQFNLGERFRDTNDGLKLTACQKEKTLSVDAIEKIRLVRDSPNGDGNRRSFIVVSLNLLNLLSKSDEMTTEFLSSVG